MADRDKEFDYEACTKRIMGYFPDSGQVGERAASVHWVLSLLSLLEVWHNDGGEGRKMIMWDMIGKYAERVKRD